VNKEDIRSLTRISRSLWGDIDQSVAISEDTLTSVSLLNLSDDRTIERASKVMIELAERNPPTLLILNHPFYRLAPIERFLLTAIHIEKWSYERVARTLGIESDNIKTLLEPWLWSIRLKFCFQETQSGIEYPRAPGTLGPSCPEYNASAPWTQRMMDDELGKRERFFLQNHLMGCDKCRKALELTRKMVFKVESLIPMTDSSQELESANERILNNWMEGEVTFRPIKLQTSKTLIKFLSQPKVQFLLAALAVYCFYWYTSHQHHF